MNQGRKEGRLGHLLLVSIIIIHCYAVQCKYISPRGWLGRLEARISLQGVEIVKYLPTRLLIVWCFLGSVDATGRFSVIYRLYLTSMMGI